MNRKWGYVLAAMCFTIGLSGCGAGRGQQEQMQQVDNGRASILSNTTQSAHLEQLAESVPHVLSANCIQIGRATIVGLNVDSKLSRAQVGTVKYTVAEALHKDPQGTHAIVTADPDLTQRMREIRAQIKQGKPISAFANELSDIIGRMIPQLPQRQTPVQQTPAETSGQNAGKP